MKATKITGTLVTNPFAREALLRVVREDGETEDVATSAAGATAKFGPLELALGDRLELTDVGGKGAKVEGVGTLDNSKSATPAEIHLRDGRQASTLMRVAPDATLPFSFTIARKGAYIEVVAKAKIGAFTGAAGKGQPVDVVHIAGEAGTVVASTPAAPAAPAKKSAAKKSAKSAKKAK